MLVLIKDLKTGDLVHKSEGFTWTGMVVTVRCMDAVTLDGVLLRRGTKLDVLLANGEKGTVSYPSGSQIELISRISRDL